VVLHVLPDLSQNKVKTNDKSINTLLRELISVQTLRAICRQVLAYKRFWASVAQILSVRNKNA